MKKFRIVDTTEGVYIEHTAYPESVIAVYDLENRNCYQGSIEDVFDFFVLRGEKPRLFQLLAMDCEDIDEDEIADYRAMLRKAWKWLLHRYLIGDDELPREPERYE